MDVGNGNFSFPNNYFLGQGTQWMESVDMVPAQEGEFGLLCPVGWCERQQQGEQLLEEEGVPEGYRQQVEEFVQMYAVGDDDFSSVNFDFSSDDFDLTNDNFNFSDFDVDMI